MSQYSTPIVRAEDNPMTQRATRFDASLSGAGGSVSEMEQLAVALRLIGDADGTERVDQVIICMLEQKIYRKIMAKSRRQPRRQPLWPC
jgi:hypothetical protein